MTPIAILDLLALISAAASAYLWFAASGRSLRRVSSVEAIDEHDINRLIVAFNRNQILNGRAALATGISTLVVALRFFAGMLP
jgi:hypothetical protein